MAEVRAARRAVIQRASGSVRFFCGRCRESWVWAARRVVSERWSVAAWWRAGDMGRRRKTGRLKTWGRARVSAARGGGVMCERWAGER